MANGANVLRELLIRIGVDVDADGPRRAKELERGMDTLRDSMQRTAQVAVGVGRAVAVGISAAAVAVGAVTVQAAQSAESVERQALALGATTEQIQEYRAALEAVGADESDLSDITSTLTDKLFDLRDGTQSAVDDFGLLGLTFSDFRRLKPIEFLDRFADAVAAEGTDEGIAAAVRILGDDLGNRVLPLLRGGSAEIGRLRTEARELGLVLSGEQLAASRKAAVAWRRLLQVGRGLRNEIAVVLAPLIERIAGGVRAWVAANRELILQRIESVILRLQIAMQVLDRLVRGVGGWDRVFFAFAGGAGVLLALANLQTIRTTLIAIDRAVRTLGVLFAPLFSAIGIGAAPALLILAGFATAVALVALAWEDFNVFLKGGDSLLERNLNRISQFIPALAPAADLIRALVRLLGLGFRNARRFGTAIALGLMPNLEGLRNLLRPLVGLFGKVRQTWEGLNQAIGTRLVEFTASIQGATAIADLEGERQAALVRRGLSSGVSSVVQRGVEVLGGSTTNNNNATVNQTNHFAGGAEEAEVVMERGVRAARLAVSGGER